MFKLFQKHPEVGVCHVDAGMDNWEPNFWNLGAEAIQGRPEEFIARFTESHPFLDMPERFTEDSVLRLWDAILDELGPVVFDKSPQYLGDAAAFELLKKYMDRGNDVRLFGVIRDPRDAITSQYELWRSHVENDSPKKRESVWLKQYQHLEALQEAFAHVPLFRYEDLASAPACYAPMLLRHCGCADIPESYAHIRATSVGRYSASLLAAVRRWKFGDEFVAHLKKYGYRIPQLPFLQRAGISIRMLRENARRERRSRKT